MDRPELRFRILFEYYDEFHSPAREREDMADRRVQKLDIADHEKNAAQAWLIDSGYVNGENHGIHGSNQPLPMINRINSYGINFVESIMDTAFTKIQGKFENIDKLSKLDKIKQFSKECLNNPATQEMCKITYQAIVDLMTNSS